MLVQLFFFDGNSGERAVMTERRSALVIESSNWGVDCRRQGAFNVTGGYDMSMAEIAAAELLLALLVQLTLFLVRLWSRKWKTSWLLRDCYRFWYDTFRQQEVSLTVGDDKNLGNRSWWWNVKNIDLELIRKNLPKVLRLSQRPIFGKIQPLKLMMMRTIHFWGDERSTASR